MSILFTFPGQGAQSAGMLHRLPAHPETERTLADTRTVLGIEPLTLDTDASLKSTVSVQLCLLIAGVAMTRVLASRKLIPDMVAGLSIGAFPAAVACGVLDFPDALRLVQRRAQLMERAYPRGYGMAAIIGLEDWQLERLIAQIHRPETPLYLANRNGRRQMVVAGGDQELVRAMSLAKQHGAVNVKRLAVNVPSHCCLFDAAAEELTTAFSAVDMHQPHCRYISGSAARVLRTKDLIADDLAHNMARRVNWCDTIRLAWEQDARLAIEMPGGTVLTELAEPFSEDGIAVACDNHSVDSLIALASRER